MSLDLSAHAVGVRLVRTEQLRRLSLSLGAHARMRGWRFAIGDRVSVAVEGLAATGRVVGRRTGATDGSFGRAYLLELDDGRAIDVGEPRLTADG